MPFLGSPIVLSMHKMCSLKKIKGVCHLYRKSYAQYHWTFVSPILHSVIIMVIENNWQNPDFQFLPSQSNDWKIWKAQCFGLGWTECTESKESKESTAYFWDTVGIHLGCFWDTFGIILGYFWGHFGIIFGCFLDIFWILFGYFLDTFRILFGYFWDTFGILLE